MSTYSIEVGHRHRHRLFAYLYESISADRLSAGRGYDTRRSALENVLRTVTQDDSWQDKWPKDTRHRRIRYFLDYDVHVDTLLLGDEEPEEKGDSPLLAPELPKSLLNTDHD
jgi:hypothetical protein